MKSNKLTKIFSMNNNNELLTRVLRKWAVRFETFEQLINFGTGRKFTVSKAHQRKALYVSGNYLHPLEIYLLLFQPT